VAVAVTSIFAPFAKALAARVSDTAYHQGYDDAYKGNEKRSFEGEDDASVKQQWYDRGFEDGKAGRKKDNIP
jgi:hypothetical protein